MSLGQQLAPHLPFLRRYARALTGTQEHGDAFVRATLEAIALDESFRATSIRALSFPYLPFPFGSSMSRKPGHVDRTKPKHAQAAASRITPLSRPALC